MVSCVGVFLSHKTWRYVATSSTTSKHYHRNSKTDMTNIGFPALLSCRSKPPFTRTHDQQQKTQHGSFLTGGPEAGEPAGGVVDGHPQQAHHGHVRVLDAAVDRARGAADQLDQRECWPRLMLGRRGPPAPRRATPPSVFWLVMFVVPASSTDLPSIKSAREACLSFVPFHLFFAHFFSCGCLPAWTRRK